MNAPLDPKKFAQVPQPSAKQYDAGDLNDAHGLATSDLNWALTAVRDIRSKFFDLNESLQKSYNADPIYFEDMITFLHMYEYVIEERMNCHKEEAARYEEEWLGPNTNPQNPPDASGLQADYGEW